MFGVKKWSSCERRIPLGSMTACDGWAGACVTEWRVSNATSTVPCNETFQYPLRAFSEFPSEIQKYLEDHPHKWTGAAKDYIIPRDDLVLLCKEMYPKPKWIAWTNPRRYIYLVYLTVCTIQSPDKILYFINKCSLVRSRHEKNIMVKSRNKIVEIDFFYLMTPT